MTSRQAEYRIAKVAQLKRYTSHAADFPTRGGLGTSGPICLRRSVIPLFTSILPTTDAVIVLIRLAKTLKRTAPSVKSVFSHNIFKMDDLLIGLSFPESRARESSCENAM
jgi:hypothetical protein